MSVAPPQLDESFATEDAPLRANEFAALGWSEDQVRRRSIVFGLSRRTPCSQGARSEQKFMRRLSAGRRNGRPIYSNRLR
jgi:hypothetical protein